MQVYDRYIKSSICGTRRPLGNDLRSKAHRAIKQKLSSHKTLWKLYTQESPFVKPRASIPALKKYAKSGAMFPAILLTQFRNKVNVPSRSNANIGCGSRGLYRAMCFAHAEDSPSNIRKIGLEEYQKARHELQQVPHESIVSSFRSRRDLHRYIVHDIFPRIMSACRGFFPFLDNLRLPRVTVEPFKKGESQAFYVSPTISCEHPRGDPHSRGHVVVHVRDLKRVDIAELTTILAHEVFPGHFYQFKVARPEPYIGRTWFLEGWALYIERFMDALGNAYKTARLRMRCMRAARCIIDPYIHDGTKHNLEACIRKYAKLVPWIPAADRFNDIMRYASMPGQATSYMMGCRRFEKWAAKYNDALTFHARVLKCPPGPVRFVEHRLKIASAQSTRRRSKTKTPM